ncbi:MAG: hypothetical protein DMG69_27100 [Acidobacteria bacterium]|nr:MAG: hypothetical protein DMG69_27100 [Acidobacteriota bacterium]
MAEDSLRPKNVVFHWIASCLLSAVILIHLGLADLGNWLADEYDDFGRLARDGWAFLWDRLKWSPRPLSELIFCAYGWVVNHSHRPLIGTFLALIWAVFIMAGLLTFWHLRRERREEELWPGLLVALALMALFVTGAGHTIWVFYWPAAVVAYLPTLAATLLLFLQVASGRLSTSSSRLVCFCCLIVATCSSETGATFVLSYGLVQTIQWFFAAFQKCRDRSEKAVMWWLVPTLISVVVLMVVRLNRYYVTELPGVAVGPTKGHPLTSLVVGTQELLVEVLGRRGLSHGWHGLGSRLPFELLLALGVGLRRPRNGRAPRGWTGQMVGVIAALWLASLFTIAAANLHFGTVCCDQQETVRRCWILLCIAGLAMLLSARTGDGHRLRYRASNVLADVLLCSAVMFSWHIKPVLRAYGMSGAVRQASKQNFQAGFRANDKQMVFLLLPQTFVAQPQIMPGTYTLSSESTDARYILTFFNKEKMVACSPADRCGIGISQGTIPDDRQVTKAQSKCEYKQNDQRAW